MPDMLSVVYEDWRGEEWLPGGGRRCQHLPTGCVFDVRPVALGEYAAELRDGSAMPDLIELAKGYFRVFGSVNPAHQPPGRAVGERITRVGLRQCCCASALIHICQ